MPAWIGTALKLIASGFTLGAAAEYGQQFVLPQGPGMPTAAELGGVYGGGGEVIQGSWRPVGEKKRRRRRRALTASDRADIAFIAGLLGPKAGKDFAVIIGARKV